MPNLIAYQIYYNLASYLAYPQGLCWSHRGVHLSVKGKRCCIDSCMKKEEVRVARLTACTRVSCRDGILSHSLFGLPS
jgi:hypothetical protein